MTFIPGYDTEAKPRMVRKLLAIGYSMHYDHPRTAAEVGMERKDLCRKHVNEFFLAKGVVKKAITDMTQNELSRCISQFERVQADTFSKL